MPTDDQLVDLKFNEGLDTRTQAKLVLPAKWSQLDNVSFADDTTARTRDAIQCMLTNAGNGLATHDAELLSINGSAVQSICISSSPAPTAPALTGSLGYATVARKEVLQPTGTQEALDCTNGAGFTVYAWRALDISTAAGGVAITMVDESTGTHIFSNLNLDTDASIICPRVVFVPGLTPRFYIFYIKGSTNSLRCQVIDAVALTLSGGVSLVTSAFLVASPFDACCCGDDSGAFVVYRWGDGITSLFNLIVTTTLGLPAILHGPNGVSNPAQNPFATMRGVACAAFHSTATGVFYQNSAAGSGVRGCVCNATGVTTVVDTMLDAVVTVIASESHIAAALDTVNGFASLRVCYDQQGELTVGAASAVVPIRCVLVDSTLAILNGPTTIINSAFFAGANMPNAPTGPWICGKPFSAGGNVMLPVAMVSFYSVPPANTATTNAQNCVFFINAVTGGAAFAKGLYGTYGVASINNTPPRVSTPASVFLKTTSDLYNVNFTAAILPVTEKPILLLNGGLNISPSGISRLEVTPQDKLSPSRAQLGGSTFFAGGILSTYDGGTVTERPVRLRRAPMA